MKTIMLTLTQHMPNLYKVIRNSDNIKECGISEEGRSVQIRSPDKWELVVTEDIRPNGVFFIVHFEQFDPKEVLKNTLNSIGALGRFLYRIEKLLR